MKLTLTGQYTGRRGVGVVTMCANWENISKQIIIMKWNNFQTFEADCLSLFMHFGWVSSGTVLCS